MRRRPQTALAKSIASGVCGVQYTNGGSYNKGFGVTILAPTVVDRLAATVLLLLWGAMGSVFCFLLWCVLLDLAPGMFHTMSQSFLWVALLLGQPVDSELERSIQCLGALLSGFVIGSFFRLHGLRKQSGLR